MLMRRALALAVLLVLASPVLAAGAAPAGGIQGVVKQPEAGMCAAGDPCDGVGRGVLLVFTRPRLTAKQVRSDADGRFRIRLAPGRYHVRAAVAGAHTTPAFVVVPKRGFARATITVAAGTVP
jgi:hypothetical protein